jgi:hypothetical protein
MTGPTPPQIEAALEALRDESDVWDGIHERLNRCASHVRTLPITEYDDVVIFGGFIAAHNDVAQRFATRCAEGAVQTFSIGLALESVAQQYAAAESANLSGMHSLIKSKDGHDQPDQ